MNRCALAIVTAEMFFNLALCECVKEAGKTRSQPLVWYMIRLFRCFIAFLSSFASRENMLIRLETQQLLLLFKSAFSSWRVKVAAARILRRCSLRLIRPAGNEQSILSIRCAVSPMRRSFRSTNCVWRESLVPRQQTSCKWPFAPTENYPK